MRAVLAPEVSGSKQCFVPGASGAFFFLGLKLDASQGGPETSSKAPPAKLKLSVSLYIVPAELLGRQTKIQSATPPSPSPPCPQTHALDDDFENAFKTNGFKVMLVDQTTRNVHLIVLNRTVL